MNIFSLYHAIIDIASMPLISPITTKRYNNLINQVYLYAKKKKIFVAIFYCLTITA